MDRESVPDDSLVTTGQDEQRAAVTALLTEAELQAIEGDIPEALDRVDEAVAKVAEEAADMELLFVNDALDRADALRTRVLLALETRVDWAVPTVEDVEILKRLLPASKAASLWVQKLEGLGCDPRRLYALHRESAARGLAGVQSASMLEEGLRRLTDLLDLLGAQQKQGTPGTQEWLHAVHDRLVLYLLEEDESSSLAIAEAA
ncbi:hypothetical protein QBZ16_002538 [Prototheca wickerhamii]|uniref:Uncharacterized protein n=1 Tax=Prototheca wickerhamii TaxID=3111 RepID=A0AAD9IPG0_PROWI|nr:hypothetical protein QBZ16_002538 [Prototheca wickerhamii]